jgi:hypothetical protein
MALLETPQGKKLIAVGGGILYYADWLSLEEAPEEGDFIDAGEVSDLVLTNDVQRLDIYSFRKETKRLIDSRVKLVAYSFEFKMLEHSIKNWAIATGGTIVGNKLMALVNPNQYRSFRFVANNGSLWEGHIFNFHIATTAANGNINLIDMEKPLELPVKGMGLLDESRDDVTSSQLYDVDFVEITT